MSYPTELEAFRAYAHAYPNNATLLIDTYDSSAGARNAVLVGKELESSGNSLGGVRIDSGDLLASSKAVRKILDKGGFPNAKILASGDLDEYKIDALVNKGAPIDFFGVGTSVGTSNDAPSLNVNYKLSEVQEQSISWKMRPVMKLTSDKRSLPGRKQVYRIIDKEGQFAYDTIALDGEMQESEQCLPLLVRWMEDGRIAKRLPKLDNIREHARQQLHSLPEKFKVFEKPPTYPVKISAKLSALIKKLEKPVKR